MLSGVCCLRVKWCFLWGRAGNISISCRHSRLSHVQLRLWRWRCLLGGVVNSCGLLGTLVLCTWRHTSTSWPDIRLNTNSCSSHPRQITVVRSSHVYGCISHTRPYKEDVSRDWVQVALSCIRTNPTTWYWLKPYHVVKTDWSHRYDVGHLLRGC